MELLTTDENAVRELLALLDEAYAPGKSALALSARVRRRLAAQSRQALRDEVQALERTLRGLLGSHLHGSCALDMVGVVLRQRRQLEAAIQENRQLKQAARRQRELARRVVAMRDTLGALQLQVQPMLKAPGRSLVGLQTPAVLRRRLDVVCERAASWKMEIVHDITHDYCAELDKVRNVLRSRMRSRSLYPFKLSAVAEEMWRLIQDHTPSQNLAQDEIYDADTTVGLRKPFGWLEVRGPNALRRVFMDDGGVLLVCASNLAGTTDAKSGNLLAGLSLRETIWARVARIRSDNPKSPVFVETVTEVEVFVSNGREENLHSDDSDRNAQTRLRRYRDFIEAYAANERGEGRRILENRLLDSILSRGNAGSV